MTTFDQIDSTMRYSRNTRIFHAVIAVLVIINIALGILHDPLSKTIDLITLHKSLGFAILILAIARLLYRLSWRTPDYAAPLGRFDFIASRLTHWALYALMIGLPLLGWVFTSASPRPNRFFGLFTIPNLPFHKGDPLVGLAHQGHELLGWAMLILVGLHVAGALRHHFIVKDGLLRRMW